MNCKTCNDSKRVYVVCYRKLDVPVQMASPSAPAVTSFVIEQVSVACPDCNRDKLHIEPAPRVG